MSGKKYQVSLVVFFVLTFTMLLFYQNCSKGGGSLDGTSTNPLATSNCPAGSSAGNNGLCYIYNPTLRMITILGAGNALHGCADTDGVSCLSTSIDLNGADGSPQACSRSGGWVTYQGCNQPNETQDNLGDWTITGVGCFNGQDLSGIVINGNPVSTFYLNFKIGLGNASTLPNVTIPYGPSQKALGPACH